MPHSKFQQLLKEKRFGEAAALLKRQIAAAEIFDPGDDETHGPYTDRLGYGILAAEGPGAFEAYWQDILGFFQDLESTWGRLHKGHMFYRLGLARLGRGLAAARETLGRALAEDRLAAGNGPGAAELVMTFPSYVTLAVLDFCTDQEFPSAGEEKRFFAGLVPLRFDAMWGPKDVPPTEVRGALDALLGKAERDAVGELHRELQAVYVQRLPEATIGLTRCFVGALSSIAGAGESGLALSAIARSTFQLVDILTRDPAALKEHAQEHPITAPAYRQIAVMLKIMSERAAVDWGRTP